MSTFFITTSRKLTILFLTELILRYENITFFGLFKRSVLRLLFAMPKLVGRSGVMVVQLSSVRGMYFSYCQNLKCRLTLAGCITSSIMGKVLWMGLVAFKIHKFVRSMETGKDPSFHFYYLASDYEPFHVQSYASLSLLQCKHVIQEVIDENFCISC